MNSGKGVYIEGVDFASDHYYTDLFSYFGCNYIHDGYSYNVQSLIGVGGTFAEDYEFNYQYDSDSDYSVDEIGADEGTLFFTSQDEKGRGVYYDGEGQYHTIFTSSLLGAMIDGARPNTKATLMSSYLSYLTQPFVDVDETAISSTEYKLIQNYPNPFSNSTVISYSINGKNDTNASIQIYNLKGELVKEFANLPLYNNLGEVVWNWTDDNCNPVANDLYFYKINGIENCQIKKMVLMR